VHGALLDHEIEAVEDLLAVDLDVQILISSIGRIVVEHHHSC